MAKRSPQRAMMVAACCCMVSSGSAFGQILAIDFDELDTAGGVTATAQGFQSFTIDTANAVVTGDVSRFYGDITVTLSPNNATFGFDDRIRATPENSELFTNSDLLRDFVFSRATGAGVTDGMDIRISGLTPNTEFKFTFWSFDSGSGGTRVSDWFANGVEVFSDYTFDGRVLPIDNSEYQLSFNAFTDQFGLAIIGIRRDDATRDTANAASFGVFLNAMQIDAIPEPSTTLLLASGLGVYFGHRRRSASRR